MSFFRRKSVLWLLGISPVIVGAMFFRANSESLVSRDSFRPYDFNRDPWLTSFKNKYQKALARKEPWVADPIAIALRVAGFPNSDGTTPNEIYAYYQTQTKMTAIVRSFGLEDDSVSAEEIKVDLVYRSQRWEIDWAGGRWKCQSGRGAFPALELGGWQNTLCS